MPEASTRKLLESWLDIWGRVSLGRDYKTAARNHAVLLAGGSGSRDSKILEHYEHTIDLINKAKIEGTVREHLSRVEKALGINNVRVA